MQKIAIIRKKADGSVEVGVVIDDKKIPDDAISKWILVSSVEDINDVLFGR